MEGDNKHQLTSARYSSTQPLTSVINTSIIQSVINTSIIHLQSSQQDENHMNNPQTLILPFILKSACDWFSSWICLRFIFSVYSFDNKVTGSDETLFRTQSLKNSPKPQIVHVIIISDAEKHQILTFKIKLHPQNKHFYVSYSPNVMVNSWGTLSLTSPPRLQKQENIR